MQDFEKLGVFYLGRPYDLAAGCPKAGLTLYDSRDMLTHAVCVGMTGSGKTGLCISILEEAAIDGIPVIAIDPKGDLSSLLLTFPSLKGEDFLPWVDEDEARRHGMSAQAFAEQQAQTWRDGLCQWGEDGERIARLRAAADFAVYTPGSSAGIPVSILKSFDVPPSLVLESGDLLRDKVTNTVTSLLALLGVDADPLRSREHILLSTILSQSWQSGKGLDLASLIQQIQNPPVSHIGAFDLESFYPAKERFGLAMALNNLVAAPGFDAWLNGEPLDVDRILYTAAGKPRVSIFSIAHLNDSERMFFVSLLFNETLSWMRAQSGTSSLRAVVYMDEIAGYCPPVANPPSKQPLLTLFKQARAFGLGVVLATQNPVDLDYKGLANAGTWLIGRLQTERDKARVLDGLEGAAAATGAQLDRQSIEQTLSALGNRIFLLHNVHEDAPEIFETRWALSYLRGPLTRNQIKTLMDARKAGQAGTTPPAMAAAQATPAAPAAGTAAATTASVPAAAPSGDGSGQIKTGLPSGARPSLPPAVPQHFLAASVPKQEGCSLTYEPRVFASGAVHFTDTKLRVDCTNEVKFLAPITNSAVPVDWSSSTGAEFNADELEQTPQDGAQFRVLPPAAAQPKNYDGWKKDFSTWLYANSKLDLLQSALAGLTSVPGETERQFRIRLGQKSHEDRDRTAEELRKKYAPKIAALEERIRRAEQATQREQQQVQDQQINSVIHVGATLLGAFMGRKAMSSANLGRATSAVRSASRAMKEQQDVARAQENVQALQSQLDDLNGEFQSEMTSLAQKFDPATESFQTISLRPKKTNINVQLVALVWLPFWSKPTGETIPAWR